MDFDGEEEATAAAPSPTSDTKRDKELSELKAGAIPPFSRRQLSALLPIKGRKDQLDDALENISTLIPL